jgi:hypothetical protein
MSEEELGDLLKQHRWTMRHDMPTAGKQRIYSASQRQGKRTVTRYIGTANKLKDMTAEDVMAKLNKPSSTQQ